MTDLEDAAGGARPAAGGATPDARPPGATSPGATSPGASSPGDPSRKALTDQAAPPDRPAPATDELRREVTFAGAVIVVLGLVGLPLGLLWSALSPRAQVVAAPGGGLDYADGETKAFITGDAVLFLLGLVAGVVAATLVWRLARGRQLGALAGLVLGAGLGSWVAWRTGTAGGNSHALQAAADAGRLTGTHDLPLQLHAHVVLLAWPGAAAAAFALRALRLWSRERSAPDLPAGPS